MPDTRIDVVDVHDDQALAEWYAVRSASVHHGRPFALHESLGALRTSVQHPSEWRRRVLISAVRDGVIVGVAEVSLNTNDNTHLAAAEINVHPEHRRQGVGRELHDAVDRLRRRESRTTVIGELYLPIGSATDVGHGLGFATAMGFEVVHTEEHLAMRLPADPITADLLTRPVPGYEVVTWTGRCPDEYRPAYLAMRNQMNADVPTGDIDITPIVLDEQRLAESEDRTARSYTTIVAAARRTADGAMGGYSVILLDHADDQALQDDTLVMPEHRGRGLGMQLKQATRAILEADYPDRTHLHTWTDPTNAAMYRTNVSFGYAAVELMHEVQRVD